MPNEMTAGEAANRLECFAESAHLFRCIPTFDKGEETFRFAASILRRVESGELREVMHCGECKYYKPDLSLNHRGYCPYYPNDFSIGTVHYCSYGERKEKDDV